MLLLLIILISLSLFFSATSGGVCITSFATVVGALVGIASFSFSFTFLLTTEIVKKLLKTTQNRNKKT